MTIDLYLKVFHVYLCINTLYRNGGFTVVLRKILLKQNNISQVSKRSDGGFKAFKVVRGFLMKKSLSIEKDSIILGRNK